MSSTCPSARPTPFHSGWASCMITQAKPLCLFFWTEVSLTRDIVPWTWVIFKSQFGWLQAANWSKQRPLPRFQSSMELVNKWFVAAVVHWGGCGGQKRWDWESDALVVGIVQCDWWADKFLVCRDGYWKHNLGALCFSCNGCLWMSCWVHLVKELTGVMEVPMPVSNHLVLVGPQS